MTLPMDKSGNGLYGASYFMLISDGRLATNFAGEANRKREMIR
jgi:hypothetical protein